VHAPRGAAPGAVAAQGTLAEIVADRPELAGRSLEEMFAALTTGGAAA
jgi:hypothetical protein